MQCHLASSVQYLPVPKLGRNVLIDIAPLCQLNYCNELLLQNIVRACTRFGLHWYQVSNFLKVLQSFCRDVRYLCIVLAMCVKWSMYIARERCVEPWWCGFYLRLCPYEVLILSPHRPSQRALSTGSQQCQYHGSRSHRWPQSGLLSCDWLSGSWPQVSQGKLQ